MGVDAESSVGVELEEGRLSERDIIGERREGVGSWGTTRRMRMRIPHRTRR